MQRPAPKMTAERMQMASRMAHDKTEAILEYARQLESDPKIIERLEKCLCKACFYGPPRIAGAAMTSQPCMCCGTDQMFASTNTDVLCQPCAEQNQLCKHCGGDIGMRLHRTDWPEPTSKDIQSE